MNYINKLSRTLLVRSTSVGSYLIIFPYANRVDPDQAAQVLPDPGLFCLQNFKRRLYEVKG